jgi:hypothetical protein
MTSKPVSQLLSDLNITLDLCLAAPPADRGIG